VPREQSRDSRRVIKAVLVHRRMSLGVLALVVAAVAALLPSAAGALTWSAPIPAAPSPPFTQPGYIGGVSCPTSRLCVAAAGSGILTSSQPAPSATAWARTALSTDFTTGLVHISCPSTHFCAAVGFGGIFTTTDPTGGPSAWKHVALPAARRMFALGCASERLCVGVGTDGKLTASGDPGGGAGGWHSLRLGALRGIACPGVHLCVALGAGTKVFTSSRPTGPSSAWKSGWIGARTGMGGYNGISCPTIRFCVAIRGGTVAVSMHPGGGGRTWHAHHRDGVPGGIVDCASTRLCGASRYGRLAIIHDPASRRGTVTSTRGVAQTISCPSERLCVAGLGERIYVTAAAASRHPSWQAADIDGANPLTAISCTSSDFCLGVGGYGQIGLAVSSTTPSGPTWARSSGVMGTSVLCRAGAFCLAGDDHGGILSSSDAQAPFSNWRRNIVLPQIVIDEGFGHTSVLEAPISGLACPTDSLCVAAGSYGTAGGGNVLVSTDPTGGVSAWTKVSELPGTAVSCPSVTFCASAGDQRVATSTNPTGGAGAWSTVEIDRLHTLRGVSCPTASLCVAVDDAGNALTSTNPGGGAAAWGTAPIDPGHALNAITCPSAGLCVAVDSAGNVLSSTDPGAPTAAWSLAHVDAASGIGGAPVQLTGVSCPSETFCALADDAGNVITGH
jgi:hypothetical protein